MTTITGTTRRTVKVYGSFERTAFLFMRLSGVALLVLAVGHMLIQHVLNNSTNLTIQFVAEQWNSWGWKTYDLFLLAFAFSHGINGFRNVIEDFVHNRQTMKVINVLLAIFIIITILWAGFAIAAFDPASIPG
jgi:succinate dehydrogenase / fumarate reductase membrane anchor subunit